MRELLRDGVRWLVREVESQHLPGTRGAHCLIFDSDGLVRRVWTYPPNWAELADATLGLLLDLPVTSAVSSGEAPQAPATSPAVAGATAAAVQARALLRDASTAVDVSTRARRDHDVLADRCDKVRGELRDAIRAYTWSLRRDGVSPEQAVIRTKSAVREGLKGCGDIDDPDGEDLMRDGVAWCIEAYYEERAANV
jgi:hypothetical protein